MSFGTAPPHRCFIVYGDSDDEVTEISDSDSNEEKLLKLMAPTDVVMASPSDFYRNLKISSTFSMHFKGITVNRNGGYTQVILPETRGKSVYISVEGLIELKEIFLDAIRDENCQVLILNGIGKSFCSGLDLKPLIGPNKDIVAREMAIALKNFIEVVASFNKGLVCVVNGEAVGLGMTLLTYSDVTISSDDSTFQMPSIQLGYPPEAAAAIMLPIAVGSTVAIDLLLRGRVISATQALECGLIARVVEKKRLPLELVCMLSVLKEYLDLARTITITKSLLRMYLIPYLATAFEDEVEELPKHWLSRGCQSALQNAFKNGLLD